MQEVIVKTIVILAVMAALVMGYNRFFGRKKSDCGCGGGSACDGCPQAPECTDPAKKEKSDR